MVEVDLFRDAPRFTDRDFREYLVDGGFYFEDLRHIVSLAEKAGDLIVDHKEMIVLGANEHEARLAEAAEASVSCMPEHFRGKLTPEPIEVPVTVTITD